MPEQYRGYGEEWQALNPDWELCSWTWDSVGSFTKQSQAVLDDLELRDGGRGTEEFFVQYADLIGYELLREFGGVYVNCDIEPVRPLNHLTSVDTEWDNVNWATYENHTDGRIVNAAIGAAKAHDKFWEYLINRAIRTYWSKPHAEMVETTGPAMLTDAICDWNDSQKPFEQVMIYPVETFNPVHWSEIEHGGNAASYVACGDFYSLTVGVHHWGHRESGRTNTIPQ